MPSDLEDRLRSALAPELELIRALGAGSTAFVYLAREPALERFVAVKVLRPEFAVDETARRRFEREARAAARLSHANVATVHRVGVIDGWQPYIVMEYVEGRPLSDVLAARGPLPAPEARTVIGGVASALAAAHARGLVHRDVRPANVFIENGTGRAVLADFGIVALLDTEVGSSTRLTAAGQRLGDIRYMSPEQRRGESVTEQSDIYALGRLALETLFGPQDDGPAPDGATAMPPPAAGGAGGTPSGRAVDLEALIRRCLTEEPNRRPRASEIPVLLRAPGGAGTPAPGGFRAFLAELRRRRVYQMAAAYAAAAFIVLQAADLLVPALPQGSIAAYNALVVITLAGFPLALVLSWLYDIRDGRLQRTRSPAGATVRGPRRFAWAAFVIAVAATIATFILWSR